MDIIKKKICLRDYECRTNPYLVNGVLPDNVICTGLTSNWGNLTGYTSNGTIEYYSGSTSDLTANLVIINILITQTFDDIGIFTDAVENWIPGKIYYFGETVLYGDSSYRCHVESSNSKIFNPDEWESNFLEIFTVDYNVPITDENGGLILTGVKNISGSTITFTGESKIDNFRRFSKTTNDKDLYNPILNSSFTQEIKDVYGNISKLISQNTNYSGTKQNLYEYVIGATKGDLENTGIHYKDIANGISQITYFTSGLTQENSIIAPIIKKEYLLGVADEPKINIDVFIDRGINSTFDKNLKLGDIRTLDDLTNYGNGYFKIKEN